MPTDIKPPAQTAPTGRILTGWKVLAIFVGFFVVYMTANSIMVYFASTTFRGLDGDRPYEAGLAYNRELEAAREQEKLGWKVGDKVTLESGIYPADPDSPWTFTIVGIYTATKKSIDRMSFIFRWDTLNDALPASGRDQIGWIVSRVDDPSHAADVGLTLDKAFDVQDTQTLSQDEASFNASFLAGISAVLRAVDIISAVILVIMTLVLGNTIAMGVRERTFEYGTLRAMGFRPGHVVFFVLAEAAFVGALGGIVGALLSYPLVERGLGRYLEENLGNLFVYVGVPRHVLVLALGLSVGLSVLAAILPARAAGNLRVTEALRRIA